MDPAVDGLAHVPEQAPTCMHALNLRGALLRSSGGVLVAKKDLKFVVRSMIITFIVSFSALTAVRIYGWGLQGVWCDR